MCPLQTLLLLRLLLLPPLLLPLRPHRGHAGLPRLSLLDQRSPPTMPPPPSSLPLPPLLRFPRAHSDLRPPSPHAHPPLQGAQNKPPRVEVLATPVLARETLRSAKWRGKNLLSRTRRACLHKRRRRRSRRPVPKLHLHLCRREGVQWRRTRPAPRPTPQYCLRCQQCQRYRRRPRRSKR